MRPQHRKLIGHNVFVTNCSASLYDDVVIYDFVYKLPFRDNEPSILLFRHKMDQKMFYQMTSAFASQFRFRLRFV